MSVPATYCYQSPAKINWFLHITGRLPNGYHQLETVFQRIDWYDELELTVFEDEIDGAITVQGDLSGTSVQDNLITRAALVLRDYAHQRGHVTAGVRIAVRKHIPTGAGLGGGSSNAATVLMALNRLWQLNIDNETLQRIGLPLGADVPFFINPHSCVLARGVGEQFTPLDVPSQEVVLIKPDAHAATPEVYRHSALIRDHAPLTQNAARLSMDLMRLHAHSPYDNDMQAAAFAIAPAIEQVYRAVQQQCPLSYVRMSGSGATVFVRPHDRELVALRRWLVNAPAHWHVRWVRTLDDQTNT